MSLTRPGEVPGASKAQAILRKVRGVVPKIRLKRCVSWGKCSSDEDILTCIHLVEDANPRAEIRSDLRGVRQKMPGIYSHLNYLCRTPLRFFVRP